MTFLSILGVVGDRCWGGTKRSLQGLWQRSKWIHLSQWGKRRSVLTRTWLEVIWFSHFRILVKENFCLGCIKTSKQYWSSRILNLTLLVVRVTMNLLCAAEECDDQSRGENDRWRGSPDDQGSWHRRWWTSEFWGVLADDDGCLNLWSMLCLLVLETQSLLLSFCRRIYLFFLSFYF